ncbi:MAG: ATP-binding protein [Deltaproteobacteria bacterium]|nr:ATP-binding protein [Myxococcales bacterium]MDP3218125.1 ATP-binding protein [Deltaproteobacteria bacterium]
MTDGTKSAKFSVDTHLFRELGELLVGRESTALIELVKNAYDADATEVTVFGENLGDPRRGVIRISDNGVGMDPDTFQRGFLRIAARLKTDGDRKSERYKRRFTGAKGIGRLAAHKLARQIEIQSIPWSASGKAVVGIDGFIDWNLVEAVETLDDVGADAIVARERPVKSGARNGTTLTLKVLRQKWTDAQRGRFLLEVEGLQAPKLLVQPLPKSFVSTQGLFVSPKVADASTGDPGFELKLEGDFEIGDNYWPVVLDAANWVLEIDASADGVRYAVLPTRSMAKETPQARAYNFSETHPSQKEGPFFHARLLLREGAASGKRDERAWSNRIAGVRVYMEGFRVLPYGEDADDWLYLSRDYNARDRKLRFLVDSVAPGKLGEVDQEGLLGLSSKHFFGGVFLTVNRSGSLEMLVNREGFVPDAAYEVIVNTVRRGIDLLTRVRAATNAAKAEAAAAAQPTGRTTTESSTADGSTKAKAEGSIKRLTEQTAELKRLAEQAPDTLKHKLIAVAEEVTHATEVSREVVPANTMVLVLASVGTQLAAFTHEVNRLLGLAADLESNIARLREEELPQKLKNRVSKVSGAASDLRRAIERQAAYLIDVVTPDARRRRSRQKAHDALNATWKLVATSAEHRGISFENDVDGELRTPPMFRAELMAIFTNLLTNAVKAAGTDGFIRAAADIRDDGELRIRLENTGEAVDPAEGERWFRPFESTTVQLDPVLGQGMGLGLGITRDILAEVGATIAFVRPRKGAATALEIVFPGATR